MINKGRSTHRFGVRQPQDSTPSYFDDLLEKALMAYERANFREWDREKAIYRYRNHTDTQAAVKDIALIFSQ